MPTLRDQLRRYIPGPLLKAKRTFQHRQDLERSLRKLQKYGPASGAAEAFRLAREYRGWGDFTTIEPLQAEEEICGLLELVRREQVRTACEIGSFMGGTLFMMTRLLPNDARLFSVDWPEAQNDELMRFPRSRKAFHEGFARAEQRVTVIHGNSQDPTTLREFAAALGSARLDFLFIDGDHSYEGVSTDFRNYTSFVRPGGLVAFHDIVPHDTKEYGVPRFWEEVRRSRRSGEFVASSTSQLRLGGGIGVVWLGDGAERP